MRIRRLEIDGFKAIRAELQWAPAVVLFGRNDAGKTNILEALAEEWEHYLPWSDARRRYEPSFREDPLRHVAPQIDVRALIELEGITD